LIAEHAAWRQLQQGIRIDDDTFTTDLLAIETSWTEKLTTI
jgi:hypothetical protein